ncbi:hypothetical protein DPMN_136839 [Dreissena polymorpha]|uniref:Uncharacterized protein n=1 Tax=Dreissena polymorpha TaxID=45954 RepID=A0A9D4G4C4_DREPO|nr:hypothetical protein DPMN_136839 [Dreissena polymorpha]
MISINLSAIDGDAVLSGAMERSVRIFHKNGVNAFEAVKALTRAEVEPDDIVTVSKGQSNQSLEVLSKFRDVMENIPKDGSWSVTINRLKCRSSASNASCVKYTGHQCIVMPVN